MRGPWPFQPALSPHRRLSLFLLAWAAWASITVQAATCYYPNGKAATGLVACTSDQYTHCCGTGDVCLSNGFCMDIAHQPYVLSRAGCTDANWGDSCPQHCHGSSDNPSGGCSIINLKFVNNTATYCCGTPVINSAGDAIVCPNSEDSFTLDTGSVLYGVAAMANVVSTATSSSTTASGTSSATGSATASATGSATTTGSSVAVTSTAAAGTDETTRASTTNSNDKIAVGAGVGVSLGVCALAAVAWALWERRQKNRAMDLIRNGPGLAKLGPGSGRPPTSTAGTSTVVGGGAPYQMSSTPYQGQATAVYPGEGDSGSTWKYTASPDIVAPPGHHELASATDRVEMMDTQVYFYDRK